MSRPALPSRTTRRSRRSLAVATGVATAIALTACGSGGTSGPGSTSAAADDQDAGAALTVVASTDVWGSIASAVGGDAVEVTSIIDDASQDPHSFEVTTRDQLLVEDADVVVQNGGGYDPFMEQLVEASGTQAPVVDAVEVSGLEGAEDAGGHSEEGHDEAGHSDEEHAEEGHSHGEFNEHVWYDLDTAGAVARAVAEALGQADPQQAAAFEANAKAFTDGLAPLQAQEAEVAAASAGAGVAITEPVPDYMLEAMGLVVRTPAEFSEAVEEGTDVSPSVLADTTALFTDGAVEALVYNEQTTGAETEAVQAAAEAAGVPVVPVTETLPDGQDYTQWMSSNIAAIRAAVGL